MTNKFLILCTLVLAFQFSGCTSNNSQDDDQAIENADVEKIDAEDSAALSPSSDEVATTTPSEDPSLQAALGEETTPEPEIANIEQTTPAANDTIATDVAAAPTLDESSLSLSDTPVALDATAPPTTPDVATNITELTAPPVDMASPDVAAAATTTEPSALTETPVIENSGSNTAMLEDVSTKGFATSAKPTGGGSLRKISAAVPYKISSGWVNGVYVARPGEKLADISKTIYSSDKTKELKKIAENSYLKNRSVKAGDKIYYVSPNRPEDSTKTLFFYEDMGMVPETYVAKKGDNLKKVAKELLGYKNAYIEMWTANPVESKDKLTEGEVIRYWKSASGVTAVAQNTPAPQNGVAQLIDQQQLPDANQAMNMPPQEISATAAMPPPPVDAGQPPSTSDRAAAASGTVNDQMPPMPDSASLPPPPPANEASAPPPPPIEEVVAKKPEKMHTGNGGEEETSGALVEGIDDNTVMTLGVVGLLVVALAVVLIRRKKKKANDHSSMVGETFVGS